MKAPVKNPTPVFTMGVAWPSTLIRFRLVASVPRTLTRNVPRAIGEPWSASSKPRLLNAPMLMN